MPAALPYAVGGARSLDQIFETVREAMPTQSRQKGGRTMLAYGPAGTGARNFPRLSSSFGTTFRCKFYGAPLHLAHGVPSHSGQQKTIDALCCTLQTEPEPSAVGRLAPPTHGNSPPGTPRPGSRCRRNLGRVQFAIFLHELIRFKRFISLFTAKLYNLLLYLIIFNAPYICPKI